MDVDDNFYDEITSLIPPPDDYNFNDFDEILNSAVSNFDSNLDLESFVKTEFGLNNFNEASQRGENDFSNFDFSSFPSPSTTSVSETSSYPTLRTPSSSSVDGDLFNPDELMNYLNDDDIKVEEFSPQLLMDDGSQQRNTPSPTGSCSSSGGSSTSGVQSDASSVVDSKTLFDQDIESGMGSMMMSPLSTSSSLTTHYMQVDDVKAPASIQTSTSVSSNKSTFLPITVPVLPMNSTPVPIELPKQTTIVRPVQQVTPLNIVSGSIIPIQKVPLANVSATPSALPSSGNVLKTSAPIKIEPKIAPKSLANGQTLKIVTTAGNGNKLTTPVNTKPKTIFLSSNDFKALMQKVNTDGKNGPKTSTTIGSSGVLPKIIMKAPNGKVISSKVATPVTPITAASVASANSCPKIIKANAASLHAKQPMQKFVSNSRAAAINILKLNAAGNGPSSGSTSVGGSGSTTMPDLSIYKGIMDEKMIKKQQRMIKNRESASLSRKKKKEYVMALETRISNLEKENSSLKGENTSLRSQLVAFAQTCQCKNGNVSEFVLNSLNIKVNGEHQHIKIAPKPSPKSIRQKMSAANVKKNIAILFAMAFMVTMNVGNFQNYLNNKNTLDNAIMDNNQEEVLSSNGGAAVTSGNTRRLLWVPTEKEMNNQLNQTKREIGMDAPPPLHFLKPVNRLNGSRKNDNESLSNAKADEPPLRTKCGTWNRRNQTEEYLRLATNLHKWIDGNGFLNLSNSYDKYNDDEDNGRDPYAMDKDRKNGNFKMSKDLFDVKPLLIPGIKGKRKLYLDSETDYERKHRKMDFDYLDENNLLDDKKSLDLFKPKISEEYLRLFKGIKRQDDTFYVLSFNMDHILLPASSYNKSARPKMSLMLPAGDPSMNGDIVLMQIDCEVINTTEVALKSDMIPEKLRPQKYTSPGGPAPAPKPNDVANNETGSTPNKNSEKKILKANTLEAKEKPTVRTYVLVGPKTQEAAAAAKKQPTIVRISPNDSRFLNVKNSTLISKIRDNGIEEIDP